MTAFVAPRVVTIAGLNLTQVRSNELASFYAINTTAAARYIKFYDFDQSQGAQSPTVGTTTPALTVLIPASSDKFFVPNEGLGFRKGGAYWFATTVNAADSDATAVAAGDLIIHIMGH